MKKHLIFSDLAGNFNEFIELLSKFDLKLYTVILLGDIPDKGPDTKKIIDYLIKHPEIIWLMGNHEHLMYKCYEHVVNQNKTKYDPFNWVFVNGGYWTLKSYGLDVQIPSMGYDSMTYTRLRRHLKDRDFGHDNMKMLKESKEAQHTINEIKKLPKDHIDHLKKLPLTFESDLFICSHAPLKEHIDSAKFQDLEFMDANENFLDHGVLWNRSHPKRKRKDGKFFIYGHMNVKEILWHTHRHPKGQYSENSIMESFGVCFDLMSEKSELAVMEWPNKKIIKVKVKEDDEK